MEISGKITQILPLQEGQGKNGPWKKLDFILETEEQYPKQVCISVWGNKIEQFNITMDAKVTVSINVESREYNGRWYTDVKAWKMADQGSGDSSNESGNNFLAGPPPQTLADVPPSGDSDEIEDDLPF